MGKMTLDDLKKLRAEKKRQMDMRDPENKTILIVVGMGTSGIAAGAKETLNAFLVELEDKGLANVSVRQAGSLGLDFAEPTVEVSMPGMPTVIYGNVDAAVARDIVRKHIIGKVLLEDH
ncbi:MAG TPA: (2Fe-2S) ferredoxin domain-containing protein, partial [Spirochaetia bacterium]|nr:(2Fe-2S) ferredoxin domain-containing protein [Spirochaetia bacterium]